MSHGSAPAAGVWRRRLSASLGIALLGVGLAITLRQVLAEHALVAGLQAREAGELDRALDAFAEARDLHPGAEALYWEGVTLLEVGRPTDALAVLEAAAYLTPAAEAHANLGVARCLSGDVDGGRRSMKLALRLDPTEATRVEALLDACTADADDDAGATAPGSARR